MACGGSPDRSRSISRSRSRVLPHSSALSGSTLSARVELGADRIAQLAESRSQRTDRLRAESALDRLGVVAERRARLVEQAVPLVREADEVRPPVVGIRDAF